MFTPEEFPQTDDLLIRLQRDMEFLLLLKDRRVMTEYHDDYVHVYETLMMVYQMCNSG